MEIKSFDLNKLTWQHAYTMQDLTDFLNIKFGIRTRTIYTVKGVEKRMGNAKYNELNKLFNAVNNTHGRKGARRAFGRRELIPLFESTDFFRFIIKYTSPDKLQKDNVISEIQYLSDLSKKVSVTSTNNLIEFAGVIAANIHTHNVSRQEMYSAVTQKLTEVSNSSVIGHFKPMAPEKIEIDHVKLDRWTTTRLL